MATMPDSFFSWVVFLLNEYGATLLQGAGVTLLLALVGTFIGCVIGLAVGICQTIPEDPNGSSFKQALVKGLKAVLSNFSRYTNDSTGNGCILWCDEPV